jgi:hypothetical protein
VLRSSRFFGLGLWVSERPSFGAVASRCKNIAR